MHNCAYVVYKTYVQLYTHEPLFHFHLTQISTYEMANPIHINPTDAARRLTIGGSDWLWVVFTIMVISAVAVFVWSQFVRIFPRVSARRVVHRAPLPKARSRKSSVSLSRSSRPHGVIVSILRYGIRLGADVHQNRV